jgi:dihydrofolate reductase
MRKVVMRVFDCSLDSVIAEDGTAFFQYCRDLPDDPAQRVRTRALYESADVHIMGRNFYQGAAEYFPTAVDHPYSDVLNAARKMVFSRTLQTADWANSTIITGPAVSD